MSSDSVRIDREGAVATVTIDRQAVLNALDRATMSELRGAMLTVQRDESVRVVIVTGAGGKAFVAGADIQELERLSAADAEAYAREGQQVLDLIEHLGKPVIAAVNGFALGGGCELAMACTLRVAADSARFGQPEVTLGVTPGFAGTQRLPRLVGRGRALDLLLTGRMLDAREALAIGLVTRVVPAESLADEAKALAATLAGMAPLAMRAIIEAVLRGSEVAFPEAAFLEASQFASCFSTSDLREGTRAFLEKRRPLFTGK
jgi:enoyl-CoA hydratase/carnithine racemase